MCSSKDYAMSYKASVNVSGGTKWVKYFAAVDFTSEGDMFREFENNRGYTSGYGYNRINARSNLDFSLTKTTTLSVNLFLARMVCDSFPMVHLIVIIVIGSQPTAPP